MRAKYLVEIISTVFMIVTVYSMCSTAKQGDVMASASAVSIEIGPVVDLHFENSRHWWVFDLPISFVNNGDLLFYLPNPEDPYMGNATFRFFLLNSRNRKIESLVYPLTPLLSGSTWRILKPRESISLSKRVYIVRPTMEANTDSSAEQEQLHGVTFLLDKEVDAEYQLFVEFSYHGQHSRWHEKWLKLTQQPQSEEELSRFWRGKIESDYLSLKLGK